MLPNFLIVGAEKSGTTTLSSMLSKHPEVFLSNPKEPRYFNLNWDKGLNWYKELFENAIGYKAVGEASPIYTWAPEFPETPKRIYDCLGDIKYIYIIRDPYKRTISHYKHAIHYNWIKKNVSFEKAIKKVPAIINCSKYYFQVEQYLKYTSANQWHILTLEELIENPEATTNEIFDFLEVKKLDSVNLIHENSSANRKKIPKYLNGMKFLKKILPKKILQPLRSIAEFCFQGFINEPKISLSSDTKDSIMKELIPDVELMSDFCKKDLKNIWQIK